MLVMEVEYLHRCVATRFNDRSQAEWPPHFARLYSALVAVHQAGDHQEVSRHEAERHALRWLARAPLPQLYASAASQRAVVTHYVPVNDTTVINQTPIRNALHKLMALEDALAAEPDARARRRLQGKIHTANRKLQATGIKMANAVDHSKEPSLDLLPAHRKKQPRTFPSVTPHDPRTYWVWPAGAPDAVAASLGGLTRRLVRLGHSSSLVRARLLPALPPGITPNWLPDPQGAHPLRVPLADQLQRLEGLHVHHQGVEPRVLPFRWQTYRHEDPMATLHPDTLPQRVFGTHDWLIFQRADGPRRRHGPARYLPLTRTADLARRVRDALLMFADRAGILLPSSITGHDPSGGRGDGLHMAVVPLPYVGSQYADGLIRGVALVLPRDISAAHRRALLATVGTWEQAARADERLLALNADLDIPVLPVHMGRAGVFHMTRLLDRATLRTLQPERWSQPARVWRSVTPVALDRNPGDLHSPDPAAVRATARRAEATLRQACQRQRLPDPAQVSFDFAPAVTGSLPATAFGAFPSVQRPGKPRRVLVHVALRFHHPVEGPLLLGAGRYYGMGLFLPMDDPRAEVHHDAG